MPRLRFVVPDTTRLDLSDGDWIEVKTELNVDDMEQLNRASTRPVEINQATGAGDVTLALDMFGFRRKRVEIYLVEWSFRGPDDRPMAVGPTAVGLLAPRDFDEIEAAIVRHEVDHAAKKTTAGATA